MQDTLIQITTMQWNSDTKEEESIQLTTEGQYTFKKDHLYLVYQESELSGMKGTTTTLKLQEDGVVSLRRYGVSNMDMVFTEGKRFKTMYHTPYGDVPMEILTKNIECEVSKEPFSAKVTIEYDICVKNLFDGKNKMTIIAKK